MRSQLNRITPYCSQVSRHAADLAHEVMKTPHTFKGPWFALAIALGILIAELIASQLSGYYDLHLNRVTVAFGAAGLVGVLASIVCKDWRSE